jgi:isopentenyl phosphate kinase
MHGASAHGWQLVSSHDFVVVHGGGCFCAAAASGL